MQRLLNAQGPSIFCYGFSVRLLGLLNLLFECVEKFPNIVVFVGIPSRVKIVLILVVDLMHRATDIHITVVDAGIQSHAIILI